MICLSYIIICHKSSLSYMAKSCHENKINAMKLEVKTKQKMKSKRNEEGTNETKLKRKRKEQGNVTKHEMK